MWFNVRSRQCQVSWALTSAGVARWFLVLVTVGLVVGPAHAQVYDAAAEFSATDNPTGVWSYGWSQTLGADFHLYPSPLSNSGIDYWIDPPIAVLNDPNVTHNGTDQVLTVGTVQWQPGQMLFHPGQNGQYSIVRWTAPADGIIAIRAGFVGADFVGPTTTDVHVLANSVSIFDGEVSGFGAGSGPSFQTIVYVSAGDTIDFAVGDGVDGNFYFDSTGIDAAIIYLFGR
jgi:hypothetical protein